MTESIEDKIVRRVGYTLDEAVSWYDYAEQLGEENEPKKYVVFLDQMMQTLPGCVKRVLDKTDLDAVLKSMLTHRIVSLMLKVCREEAKVQGQHDRTRGQLLDFQIALKKRMEEETRLQLRPYIALLGLVNFPEHF